MKNCSKCHIKLRISKEDSYCKDCYNAYVRDWYRRNNKIQKERVSKNSRELIATNRKRKLEYLQNHPCIDCGEKDPIVLEFDHRDPKQKLNDISNLISGGFGWNRILAEIQKCDVRCANCHRRITFFRGVTQR